MDFFSQLPDSFYLIIFVGFLAQLIDGSLGMAYGVSCNSFLLSLGGISASRASAAIHTAELFTTLASGIAHWRLRNIDKQLFFQIVFTGSLGGACGAFFLSCYDSAWLRPIICTYLILMGLKIIARALLPVSSGWPTKHLAPLGLLGGLLDAIGGGGWGPVVTSTLIASGQEPRLTIGTVNLAEFFVTLAEVLTFTALASIGDSLHSIVALIIGGLLAAPLGAKLSQSIPAKPLMLVVGILVIALNVYSLMSIYLL